MCICTKFFYLLWWSAEQLRLYTIKIHALKRSAKLIGAIELSELAAALEDAGNMEDKVFIDENTEKLLSEYESFKEKLGKFHSHAED